MKIGIDWKQASTKRGAVALAVGILGGIGYLMGNDVQPVILLGNGVLGILGLAIKD